MHGNIPVSYTHLSDGPGKQYMDDGCVDGAWRTANFGSKGAERFEAVKKIIGDQPLMCMEYWVGWFDHWGMKEHLSLIHI